MSLTIDFLDDGHVLEWETTPDGAIARERDIYFSSRRESRRLPRGGCHQGFSNAKFGRIECHEAINAFAREILLTAKQQLEAGGWRVVHGIVDSIWVTLDTDVDDEDREDLETLATEIQQELTALEDTTLSSFRPIGDLS